MKIRIIGFGRLAQSLVPNWKNNHQIIASSPNITEHKDIICTSQNASLLDVDVLILCVKPQLINCILNEIGNQLPKQCIVVSTAAGITLKQLQKSLPPSVKVYRAMPNIAASIGESATLLYGDTYSSLIEALFLEIGSIDWVNNDDILDMGTILAGSGPAYFFYIMQQFQNGITGLGMPEKLAKKLILQTCLGAAQLAKNSSISLEQLQQQVTSPKGTTAAAIQEFENNELGNILHKGLNAAWQRILELQSQT